MTKPRLATFFTGGTISMRIDAATGGAIPMLSGEEIIAQVPGLGDIADYDLINFDRLPGPHWTVRRMLELAAALREKLAEDGIVGAVVTHGTDTLEETAYFLDLVLDTEKPVVLIGAMRNSSELSWDGPENLAAAVRVAIDPQARGLGVVVAMNSQIISALEATKTHTESTDTFQSRDFGPLGFVDKDRVIVMRRPFEREHILTDKAESRVDIIKMHIGADDRFINFAIDQGARGLVIEALGRGNVTPAALPGIQRAIDAGVPVVITSRCPRGRVLDTYAYEGAGKQLRRMGAILGGMLPSYKARIKLMLALGAGWSVEQIRTSFEK
ncbi:MAG TPA: asparaginase [Blastocatellia bacterium]|nr:asparaginase [Blastocatellia bacterium]HMX29192.1 asparaginase [Blastocatellia bacterium]HMZ22117.1 asparaginase [Blastocatellia bacterium]HNG30939.1 asparaginase [Blastocatellia bacterium]